MASFVSALFVGTAATSSAAATAGLVGFGGSVTAAGVLSTGLAVAGTASSIIAGKQQEAQLKAQSFDQELEAQQTEIEGVRRQREIREQTIRILNANLAAAGDAGVAPESFRALTSSNLLESNRDRTLARLDANTRATLARAKGRDLLIRADQARKAGIIGGFDTLGQHAFRRFARG